MHISARIRKWLRGVHSFFSDPKVADLAGIVHLQTRLRKNRQIDRRSVLQNRMRHLPRRGFLRGHHGILPTLGE